MKAIAFCRTVCIATIFAVVVGCAFGRDKVSPRTIVDLGPFGIPEDFFRDIKYCQHERNGVRSLFWLDANQVVFAFSTNPTCPSASGEITASIRVMLFQFTGEKLASRDVPYDPENSGIRTWPVDGVYAGPDNTVVVCTLKIDRTSRLSLLSKNLEPIQELNLPFGTSCEGVTSEHHWIMLETSGENSGDDHTYYSGLPLAPVAMFYVARNESILRNVGEMKVALVDASNEIGVRKAGNSFWSYIEPKKDHDLTVLDWLADGSLLVESRRRSNDKDNQAFVLSPEGIRIDLPRMPPPYRAVKSFGFSVESSRIAIGGHYVNEACVSLREVLPVHCSEKHRLFVLDEKAGKIILERPLHGYARAALAPDGHHIAVLDDDKLLVYLLP
jgi:hypothetical protein